MSKGTLVILVLLLLIAGLVLAFIVSDRRVTAVNSAGAEIPVAANASNIQAARRALALDSVKYGTIYYYYVDGRPESAGPGFSNLVAMSGVTEKEAVQAVQGSIEKGTYRIIALRTLSGAELTTCPYVVNDLVRDSEFG